MKSDYAKFIVQSLNGLETLLRIGSSYQIINLPEVSDSSIWVKTGFFHLRPVRSMSRLRKVHRVQGFHKVTPRFLNEFPYNLIDHYVEDPAARKFARLKYETGESTRKIFEEHFRNPDAVAVCRTVRHKGDLTLTPLSLHKGPLDVKIDEEHSDLRNNLINISHQHDLNLYPQNRED